MIRRKRITVTILLIINIFMLVIPVIPHHHHPDKMICMKQDLSEVPGCPAHHHHPGQDSCCDSECMTRFHSPTPARQANSGPHYLFVTTLFTHQIIERLFHPQEKQLKDYSVYRESLHGTNIARTFSLRAPPCTIPA
ncbi:hypothetical protein IX307_002688 [Bacteroides pyogenes]|uniref:DUF6769 family protein n=1 Tax=Bacteroides pyogenes TaxID=310300 RepID=UPI001BA59E70|nr:DUF6769 family protein [Bacteroides pyogenes]MBR8721470.1 hypothetical protein [Bacteroides pyogenes]MBR8725589.1 hypothetical protein [Bacteroides pyogenes]MBR8738836.1 hypothetical protein [Bacteroides pyogenes]MBR8754629.1 hypothetical protein [Bacteroides pyogenes]MBR8788338.1 hypothetical protein [Bacteroides pyogenes]